MSVQRVWLPFPPSVNNLFSQAQMKGKSGRMVTRRFPSKAYKSWRREALVLIKAARLAAYDGPVAVKIALTPPSAARRDADNYLKGPLDALVEMRVLADDSQVQKLLAAWDHAAERPGVVIEIGEMAADHRPPLTPSERVALARLKRAGNRLVGVKTRVTQVIRALVAKGYVRELPGLIDGAPQGFAVAE